MGKTYSVLIVDDSSFIRTMLQEMINSFDDYKVVGSAGDPYFAAQKIVDLEPDIVTLDIEMPVMNGLVFLEKLMKKRPMPVIIISSYIDGTTNAQRALNLGAIDMIQKPAYFEDDGMIKFREEILNKLNKAAEKVKT